jgi:hypothetical protein
MAIAVKAVTIRFLAVATPSALHRQGGIGPPVVVIHELRYFTTAS